MKLKKTPKDGVCDAMRCTAEPFVTRDGGVKLCVKHGPLYDPSEHLGYDSTALVAPDPGPALRSEVVHIEADALDWQDRLTAVQVNSPEELEAVGQLASYVQGKLKEVEAQRKRATAPLTQAKKEIDSWFRPAKDAYTAAKQACSAAMSRYTAEKRAEQAQALASGDHETAMAVAVPALPAGTHSRRSWTFRVTDPAVVPREFLAVDAARVMVVVNDARESTSIPGIQAYENEILVTRS